MDDAKEVRQIPIEDIIPNRFQPRINFDEKALNELAESIKQHGIIQPLVLRPLGDKFEIIAGERRYKAATIAGLSTVPAIVTSMDDNTSAEVALIENVQRKDLTSIEEAKSYKNMLDRGNMTQEELAKKMGLSQSTIANKLRLLNLDNSVQDALMNEKISERHARALLSVSDKEEQKRWLDRIINERLTVRQLDLAIKDELSENKAPEIVDGDIPKVDINPDIESIINNAVDINPVKEDKNIDLLSSEPSPAVIEANQNPAKVAESENPQVEDKPSETESVEISKPQNKFFNVLESEEVNMSTEEPKKDAKNIEPASDVNGVFNFTPEYKNDESNEFVPDNSNNFDALNQNTVSEIKEESEEQLEKQEPIFSIENVGEIDSLDDEPVEETTSPEVQTEVNAVEPQVEENDEADSSVPIEPVVPEIVQEETITNEQVTDEKSPEFVFDEEPELIENQELSLIDNNPEDDAKSKDEFKAEPIPPVVGEGIVDPVTYFETLDPDFIDRIKATIGVDLKTAISSYRELTQLLISKGFKISLEEADSQGQYVIQVNIDKE